MATIPTEIRSLARAHAKTAVATLAGIMRQRKAPAAARVAAAQVLLDRGYGKPKQPLTGGDEDDRPIELIERHIVRPGDTDR
jgi:hypothetical protein